MVVVPMLCPSAMITNCGLAEIDPVAASTVGWKDVSPKTNPNIVRIRQVILILRIVILLSVSTCPKKIDKTKIHLSFRPFGHIYVYVFRPIVGLTINMV
jgi:hypothetical protein